MGVIAKQSLRGTIVTYVGVAVGFVTTFFVLTRFLTSEEIGLARVLIDAATLFVGLAQLGTSSSIIRFYPYFKDPSHHDHGFFFWTLIVPLVGFILFAAIYGACHVPLSGWFGEKSPLFVQYYYFVLPISFFLLYQTVFEVNANVRMHIVVPRAVRELLTRVGMLVVYLLYAFRILSMDGFVIAIGCVYAFAALCNIVYMASTGYLSLKPDWTFLKANRGLVRRYALYTGFLLISAVTSVLAPSLSSFFITAKMGLGFTGIFAIATYMAVMVSIPYRSVGAIASPQLSSAIKDGDAAQASHLLQQVTNTMLLIGGFIFLTIWVNIDLIFTLLPNGGTYASARMVVFYLGLSQLLLATCSFCLTAISYSRYYAFSFLLSVILTVLSIVLNNYLIPLYGMDGAAMSNLLSYGIYIALAVITLKCTTRYRIFNVRFLWSLLLVITIIVLNTLWLRWCPMESVWVSSIVRSAVLLGGGMATAWFARLSPDINAAVSARLSHHA